MLLHPPWAFATYSNSSFSFFSFSLCFLSGKKERKERRHHKCSKQGVWARDFQRALKSTIKLHLKRNIYTFTWGRRASASASLRAGVLCLSLGAVHGVLRHSTPNQRSIHFSSSATPPSLPSPPSHLWPRLIAPLRTGSPGCLHGRLFCSTRSSPSSWQPSYPCEGHC